jgi:cytochrome c oxidase cbb3-type subunit 4
MDINDIRSLVTVISLVLFLGLMVRTWNPSRRDAHAQAARLAFDDEADPRREPTP